MKRKSHLFKDLLLFFAALLCIAFLLTCGGCASGPRMGFATYEARNAELAWQMMHAMDTMQTVTIACSPDCLYEANPLASAVYGTKHPSVERVVVTNLAGAGLHWAAGSWLDRATERSFANEGGNRGALYVARIAFYATSFLSTGDAVVGNFRLGIKPLAKKSCTP